MKDDRRHQDAYREELARANKRVGLAVLAGVLVFAAPHHPPRRRCGASVPKAGTPLAPSYHPPRRRRQDARGQKGRDPGPSALPQKRGPHVKHAFSNPSLKASPVPAGVCSYFHLTLAFALDRTMRHLTGTGTTIP